MGVCVFKKSFKYFFPEHYQYHIQTERDLFQNVLWDRGMYVRVTQNNLFPAIYNKYRLLVYFWSLYCKKYGLRLENKQMREQKSKVVTGGKRVKHYNTTYLLIEGVQSYIP